ncbi:MAG TPA: hypothetical protein VI895_09740 [Bdellovibrionota bacterium]|nr:hypothetical protein [Bdellovibrionota bacterium]
MKSVFALSALALLGCIFTSSAQATMLEQWDTRRLTKEAKWIQRGEITSMWSSWDPERRMIYTYIKMRVDETLKGEKKGEVLFRQPGGQSGKLGMTVHGVAHFTRGEQALVFLKEDDDGAPSLAGMAQGKFRIFSNPKGEETALFRAPSNVEFFTRGESGQVRHIVTSQTERRIPVRELVAEIRAAMLESEGLLSQ